MAGHNKIILGMDPGSHKLGIAILEKKSSSVDLLFASTFVAPKDTFHLRLKNLDTQLSKILQIYAPNEIAIEDSFFAANAKTAFQLGITRGFFMRIFIDKDLPIFEYTPTQVKASVTGSGRADKEQVKKMIQMIFNTKLNTEHYDTTDAIAIAVCHAHATRLKLPLNDRVSRRQNTL